MTMCAYAVDCENIADLTDPATITAEEAVHLFVC